ncbi:MAG TPA: hypothetical protein PKA33_01450 [Amaricoccus sp.]|uniref:hypothetical protein n=1 Tax=Amaricoccus sp. TaxID=1872485 RepID=UPI002B97E70B|nr:hypothetical protein [Amaricoccus sp.]HMQ38139.1 hypothetical protein [Micropruina sp.]HMR51239.1 hypothetical protein [Amaricoccus sp.]HMT98011.1 hypothetical protein [Amaricoccus sp.]
MPITAETSTAIAYAHREIETAQRLLENITEAIRNHEAPDIRDAFGRLQGELQLGIPSGSGAHRLYNLPWSVCKPVLEMHIAQQRAIVDALSEKALAEMRESLTT